LSTVCGGGTRDKTVKKKDEARSKEADTEIEIIPLSVQTRSEARYMERQRSTKIVAAKSLLVEELTKVRPSADSIVTFHAAADGGDKSGKEVTTNERPVDRSWKEDDVCESTVMKETDLVVCDIPHVTSLITTEIEAPYEIGTHVDEIDEGQVIVSDDDAMSVGDSEDGSSGSDGFSRTDSNSSHGESNRSHGSRKRPADESPEREYDENRRREFPGTVSRIEGGCRIYVPSSMITGALDVMTQLITDATDTTNAAGVADTTDAPGAQCASNETLCASRKPNVRYVKDSEVSKNAPAAMSTEENVIPVTVTPPQEDLAVIGLLPTDPDENQRNLVASTGDDWICERRPMTPVPALVESLLTTDLNVMSSSASSSQQNLAPTIVFDRPSNTVLGTPEDTPITPIRVRATLAAEGWARDAQVVEGIFRIMEGMEPPWVTIEVLEEATLRFPTVDRQTLQRTIMTVMMTQRRCVVRLTRAGLRRGPRTDRDGNSFVELDLDFADRYSMSH